MSQPAFPNAVAPEREYIVDSNGVGIHVVEWGDPDAEPLLLFHGMWDHARSFDVFAPLLARRFRVVAFDQRGHGDSSWAPAYAWMADVRDAANVIRTIGRPVHLVGHSKGGGLATDTSKAIGEMARTLTSIDGFGPRPEDFQPATPERFAQFLDLRRKLATRETWKPYATIEDLIERRKAQNPRLTPEWLRYFVLHGARQSEDGWRWKSDPMNISGFGPWRPEWLERGYEFIRVPMLAIVGSEHDTWGPLPDEILDRRLRPVTELTRRTITGAGHFVHIENPVETATAVLEFLEGFATPPPGPSSSRDLALSSPARSMEEHFTHSFRTPSPNLARTPSPNLARTPSPNLAQPSPPTPSPKKGEGEKDVRLNHGRVELALHELRGGDGLPLLALHSLFGSGEEWHGVEEHWPGPVYALDFCGHGRSERLPGGAYVPELLAADADTALRQIGPAAVVGRGIGAYAALMLAGGRPRLVRAALLLPGSGLEGGGGQPRFGDDWDIHLERVYPNEPTAVPFDPLLRILLRDPRPGDYAAVFAAAASSLLFADDGTARPPWWTAARAACASACQVDPILPFALGELVVRARSGDGTDRPNPG